MSVQTYCWCDGDYDKSKAQLAALKEENERLKARVAELKEELAAIACKQGSGRMTIKRYDLLDLSTADGPSAMVTESEEGTYVLYADYAAEVAALKARIAELEEELAASEK